MNRETFNHKFNECWSLLEKGRPPEGKSAAYFRKVKHLEPRYVFKAFNYFNDSGKNFPSGPDLITQIKYAEAFAKSNVLLVVPPHVLEMSPAEIEADYQKLSKFFKAYPYPDAPISPTLKELNRIDRGYENLMRKFDIDPDEPTNPEVGKKLLADIFAILDGSISEVPW